MSAGPSNAPRPGSFWGLFRRPAGWALLALLLATATSALWLQGLHMRAYKERIWYDAFVLPKPQHVEKLALGYNAWFADFLFLRAIQAFGGASPARLPELAPAILNYFEVISKLDPHFLYAYNFGTLVVGDSGGRNDLALKYLETGQRENWRRYTPWSEAAVIKVVTLKQHDNDARYYVRQAAKAVDATAYISHWESYIDESAGEFKISVDRLVRQYARDYDARNDLWPIAWRRIEGIIQEWPKKYLQQNVEKYFKERGKWPDSLEQMLKDGFLGEWEMIDKEKLAAQLDPFHSAGKLEPRVDQFLKAATVKMPPIPSPPDPTQGKFVIIPSQGEPKRVVITEKEREDEMKAILEAYRGYIREYHAKNKAYPKTIQGVAAPEQGLPAAVNDLYDDGPWDYNPATGEIRSRNRPDL